MAAPLTQDFALTAALSDLTGWLIQQGLENRPVDLWLETMCDRLVAAGIPIMRVNLSMRAHHPEIGAVAFRWHRDQESEQFSYNRNFADEDMISEYLASPLYYLLANEISEIDQRLDLPDPELDFPIFDDLRALGATHYFAAKKYFLLDDQTAATDPQVMAEGMTITMATDAEGGFSPAHLEGLRALLSPLCLTLKSGANRKMAEDITAAYLGADAGRRVLSGDLARGSCETLSAVIWYFDLQGFTKLSETLAGAPIIELLNGYFGEAVEIVERMGGNVLKFMGDGMLAIFDLTEMPDARAKAVEAACEVRERLAQFSAEREAAGLPTTGFTLALHAGEVLYGNIGGKSRLDFTVIGPAVNTTARMLGMTSALDQKIIISSNIARPLMDKRDDLVSLGQYRMRGVTERHELFTLD